MVYISLNATLFLGVPKVSDTFLYTLPFLGGPKWLNTF